MSYEDDSRQRGADLLDTLATKAQEPPRLVSLEVGELLLLFVSPGAGSLLGSVAAQANVSDGSRLARSGKNTLRPGASRMQSLSGAAFLKWRADKPRKVVYIDGEMAGAEIQGTPRCNHRVA